MMYRMSFAKEPKKESRTGIREQFREGMAKEKREK